MEEYCKYKKNEEICLNSLNTKKNKQTFFSHQTGPKIKCQKLNEICDN